MYADYNMSVLFLRHIYLRESLTDKGQFQRSVLFLKCEVRTTDQSNALR